MSGAKRDNVKDCKPQMRYLHPRFIAEALCNGRSETVFEVLTALKMRKDLKPGLHSCVHLLTSEILTEFVIDQCAYGMMAGALKYDPWNFLAGFTVSDVLDSLERHLLKWRAHSLSVDEDTTGRLRAVFPKAPAIYHYGLVACNVNMLYWLLDAERLTEDRGFIQFLESKNETK